MWWLCLMLQTADSAWGAEGLGWRWQGFPHCFQTGFALSKAWPSHQPGKEERETAEHL